MADAASPSGPLVCAVCRAANPASDLFCGQCGSRLDPSTAMLKEQIRAVLKSELKDQKVLEIETAQQVATRLTDWAKTFGVFAGALLAILLATLAIWGWRSFADIDGRIKKAADEAVSTTEQRIQRAQKRAADLDSASLELDKRYSKLRDDASRYEALEQEVDSLKKSVAQIEKRHFEPSSVLTPELQRTLEPLLAKFQVFVAALGYTTKQVQINILIAADDKSMPGAYAFYDEEHHRIWMIREAAGDPGNMLREYMHSVLYSPGTPTSVDRLDQDWQYYAVESGLAYYFPASFLDSPDTMQLKLGETALWDETSGTFQKAMYDRAKVWASICWQLRKSIERSGFERALLATWFEFEKSNKDTQFARDFARKLLDRLGPASGTASGILKSRGVKL
jgi:hypothetical protein